jgi:hypothetical protein
MAEEKDTNLALHDRTGALLMLNKNERKLLKELLDMTLKSKNAREWIIKKLGNEYIEIGESLLKAMGGK